MHNVIDVAGHRFGRLTAIEWDAKPSKGHGRIWRCICDCGNTHFSTIGNLRSGNTTSCGCGKGTGEASRTHGCSHTREWRVWATMKARCSNPNHIGFRDYGGRGITVCARWQHDFSAFLADMGPRPSSRHSIDRIDNNGPYSPENCRWVTRDVQGCNTRRNVYITHNGTTKVLQRWCDDLGLSRSAMRGRLRRGWSIERALSTPPDRRPGRHPQ